MEEKYQLNAHISSKLQEEEKEIDNELKDANIDSTDRIFNKIIDLDFNTRDLKVVEKFNDFWHNTEEEMADATAKYQTEVKVQNRIKSDTIKYCESEDRKEELKAENKRNELIRDYQSLKKDNLNIWKHWKIKQARLMNMKRKC
jgi:hypothetical protein